MRFIFFSLLVLTATAAQASTRADSLRGGNGPGRRTWDVQRYNLRFSLDTLNKKISGSNLIEFKYLNPTDSLQIDLQGDMRISKAELDGSVAAFRRDSNVTWIYPESRLSEGKHSLRLSFSGKPRIAVQPPWDGGFIWTRDSAGNPWISVACQGLGASSWWPCKDYQGDEPDAGVTIIIEGLLDINIISNGRNFVFDGPDPAASAATKPGRPWAVQNPINLYDVCFYAGSYSHWADTMLGEAGVLKLNFYPLEINESRARSHWAMVRDMLHCYEHWMGPYPFYNDGYKLVEAPFLGMEHQSAVAYGNGYKMGYMGRDRSRSGEGLYFDFITVHESGHEWFGNSITAKDPAENWIHEGFTTYIETLYTEWIRGRDAAFRYARGEWRSIQNDRPVVGKFGVNDQGSSDRYDKGAALVHMIRMMLHDDERFRQMLRGVNKQFYHQTIEGKDLEAYICKETGTELSLLFEQYLRQQYPPTVELKGSGKKISARFSSSLPGLKIPVYDQSGKYVCDLSSKTVRLSVAEVAALKNYYFMYVLKDGAVAPVGD